MNLTELWIFAAITGFSLFSLYVSCCYMMMVIKSWLAYDLNLTPGRKKRMGQRSIIYLNSDSMLNWQIEIILNLEMINHAFQLDFFFPHLGESNRNIIYI